MKLFGSTFNWPKFWRDQILFLMDSNFYLGCLSFFQGVQEFFLGWSTTHINLKLKNFKVLKKKNQFKVVMWPPWVTCRVASTYHFFFLLFPKKGIIEPKEEIQKLQQLAYLILGLHLGIDYTVSLFYYLAYFYFYLCVSLHFSVLFINPTILRFLYIHDNHRLINKFELTWLGPN